MLARLEGIEMPRMALLRQHDGSACNNGRRRHLSPNVSIRNAMTASNEQLAAVVQGLRFVKAAATPVKHANVARPCSRRSRAERDRPPNPKSLHFPRLRTSLACDEVFTRQPKLAVLGLINGVMIMKSKRLIQNPTALAIANRPAIRSRIRCPCPP